MSIESRTNKKGERRYEVRLRDPTGREYSKTFRTRKDAERHDATERADRARGRWLDPRTGAVTFGTWAAEWLRTDPAKSPSAWARDDSILRTRSKRRPPKTPTARPPNALGSDSVHRSPPRPATLAG